MMQPPEIRVHVGEGFIAVKDRPDLARPWAKVVPGVTLTDEDVADWRPMQPADRSPARTLAYTAVYRVALAPDAALEVEDSGNVVLVTPERRVTVTHVERWRDELDIARQAARALDV